MLTDHDAHLPACMGGWCAVRNQCARYHQPYDRDTPAERLCELAWRSMFVRVSSRVDRELIPIPAYVPVPKLPTAA